MHIAIEGFDGVGKTTVCNKLAEKLNFRFVEKPLHYLFDTDDSFDNYLRIRDYINVQENDKILTAWFYGLGNIFLYHQFSGENIITDRHLVSNYCWSGTEENKPIYDCLIKLIGQPDYTFLLYADEDVVKSRLKKRDKNDPDMIKTHLIPEAYKKMELFLQDYNMKYKRIDSTNLDPDAVVEIILNYLSEDGIL